MKEKQTHLKEGVEEVDLHEVFQQGVTARIFTRRGKEQ